MSYLNISPWASKFVGHLWRRVTHPYVIAPIPMRECVYIYFFIYTIYPINELNLH